MMSGRRRMGMSNLGDASRNLFGLHGERCSVEHVRLSAVLGEFSVPRHLRGWNGERTEMVGCEQHFGICMRVGVDTEIWIFVFLPVFGPAG